MATEAEDVTVSQDAGRQPIYRGIRCRSGKWVSEIREPRKTTRIWLGTYATPEMAAVAYDVAALALKGPEATINFPCLAPTFPLPASFSPTDIRAAASAAASEMRKSSSQGRTEAGWSNYRHEFIDEEALFEMPKLLVHMAAGMLVSPPRMKAAREDEESSGNNSRNDRLWSYP